MTDVHIEFRVICNMAKESHDRFIERAVSTTTPNVGVVVSLKGNPYVVYRVSHSYSDCGKNYSYIRVIPAFDSGTWV